MLKRFLFIFTCLVSADCLSQDFPLNAEGKVSYGDVAEVDSFKMDDLYQNGLKWIASLKHEKIELATKDSLSGNLSGRSSFFVYAQKNALRKISGRISYLLSIEVKDNKYRYRFTDFVFHYYKPDRTYTMKETGKTRMLEDDDAPGWQNLWKKHQVTVAETIKTNIEQLKVIMKERRVVQPVLVVKKPVEW